MSEANLSRFVPNSKKIFFDFSKLIYQIAALTVNCFYQTKKEVFFLYFLLCCVSGKLNLVYNLVYMLITISYRITKSMTRSVLG